MSDPFKDRMREAAIGLRDDDLASLRSAVDETAGSNLAPAQLLDLVRIAFRLRSADSATQTVAELFARRNVTVSHRSRQLGAMLAALVLIERFTRLPGQRRTVRRIQADALAAGAVLVLVRRGETAVHPDLESFAQLGYLAVIEHVRGGATIQPIPALPGSLSGVEEGTTAEPVVDASTAEPATVEGLPASDADDDTSDELEELTAYSAKLHRWLQRSSSAARLASVEEQLAVNWWLQSRRFEEDVAQAVVRACDELNALCAFIPGPPAAQELLARRLAGREDPVTLEALAATAARAVPTIVQDICALLTGQPNDERSLLPIEAAPWLYAELQLAQLAQATAGGEAE
ncbi:MAG: hypothetical protein ACRDQZ_26230, partial [Mycobacteriales bacterium]